MGNVPGLQKAGVMWAEGFTRFLTNFGFTQPTVDRRLFYMSDEEGRALLLVTLVDDSKLVVQSGVLVARFNKEWEENFSDPLDAVATARDFLGLKYNSAPAGAIEISCGKALGDLGDKLEGMVIACV